MLGDVGGYLEQLMQSILVCSKGHSAKGIKGCVDSYTDKIKTVSVIKSKCDMQLKMYLCMNYSPNYWMHDSLQFLFFHSKKRQEA